MTIGRLRKVKRYPIPTDRNSDPVRGEVIVARQYPISQPGHSPRALPVPPLGYDFDKVVDYYACKIADYLQHLNRLQWNLEEEETPIPTQLDGFKRIFLDLAALLEVTAPETLSWPLHGAYQFKIQRYLDGNGRPHTLDVVFDSHPVYGLALNFEMILQAEPGQAGGPAELSSGSSYMATGSR